MLVLSRLCIEIRKNIIALELIFDVVPLLTLVRFDIVPLLTLVRFDVIPLLVNVGPISKRPN